MINNIDDDFCKIINKLKLFKVFFLTEDNNTDDFLVYNDNDQINEITNKLIICKDLINNSNKTVYNLYYYIYEDMTIFRNINISNVIDIINIDYKQENSERYKTCEGIISKIHIKELINILKFFDYYMYTDIEKFIYLMCESSILIQYPNFIKELNIPNITNIMKQSCILTKNSCENFPYLALNRDHSICSMKCVDNLISSKNFELRCYVFSKHIREAQDWATYVINFYSHSIKTVGNIDNSLSSCFILNNTIKFDNKDYKSELVLIPYKNNSDVNLDKYKLSIVIFIVISENDDVLDFIKRNNNSSYIIIIYCPPFISPDTLDLQLHIASTIYDFNKKEKLKNNYKYDRVKFFASQSFLRGDDIDDENTDHRIIDEIYKLYNMEIIK